MLNVEEGTLDDGIQELLCSAGSDGLTGMEGSGIDTLGMVFDGIGTDGTNVKIGAEGPGSSGPETVEPEEANPVLDGPDDAEGIGCEGDHPGHPDSDVPDTELGGPEGTFDDIGAPGGPLDVYGDGPEIEGTGPDMEGGPDGTTPDGEGPLEGPNREPDGPETEGEGQTFDGPLIAEGLLYGMGGPLGTLGDGTTPEGEGIAPLPDGIDGLG